MSNILKLSKSVPVSMADKWFYIANIDHFWIQWRFEALKKLNQYLPSGHQRVLEIGCGNGIVLQQLEQQMNYIADGCDLNLLALDMIKQNQGKVMLYNIYDKKPELLNQYPVVFLMDVIEHINDDVDFLKTSMKYLEKDGVVVLNVPAGNYLFSKYDTEAGHIRRYNENSIKKLFEDAGLEPVIIKYWGGSLIPIAIARKLYLKFSKNDKIIYDGFAPPGKISHLFLKLLKKLELSMPFFPLKGTSILAIGKVKN